MADICVCGHSRYKHYLGTTTPCTLCKCRTYREKQEAQKKLPDIVTQINDAMFHVLKAADRLVDEYTQNGPGMGTQKGMENAENELIRTVREWRQVCGGERTRRM